MPRYYLHIRREREFRTDREGWDFPDEEIAGREAIKAVVKVWRSLESPPDPTHYAIEISDENGQALFTIPFAIALESAVQT